MSADPQRFAQVVLGAFEAAGLFTDPQVIAAGGPSTSTMTLLRKVANPDDPTTMAEPREPTWSKVDNAAGWVPGSARQVWKGGEPTPRDATVHAPAATAHLDLKGSVGAPSEDSSYVASPGERKESGMADDQVLREIRAMREDTNRRLDELSERVAKLEQPDP